MDAAAVADAVDLAVADAADLAAGTGHRMGECMEDFITDPGITADGILDRGTMGAAVLAAFWGF